MSYSRFHLPQRLLRLPVESEGIFSYVRKPVPGDETSAATLQREAAMLFVEGMRSVGFEPGHHTAVTIVDGREVATSIVIVGWRIPTAKFDGTPQAPIRDCIISPTGEIFPRDQDDSVRSNGALSQVAVQARLPVYGLLEGIIDRYEAHVRRPLPAFSSATPQPGPTQPTSDSVVRHASSIVDEVQKAAKTQVSSMAQAHRSEAVGRFLTLCDLLDSVAPEIATALSNIDCRYDIRTLMRRGWILEVHRYTFLIRPDGRWEHVYPSSEHKSVYESARSRAAIRRVEGASKLGYLPPLVDSAAVRREFINQAKQRASGIGFSSDSYQY